MPSPDPIVSGIRGFGATTEGPALVLKEGLDPSLTVRFDDGDPARLNPNDAGFSLHRKILSELHRVGLPVYAEVGTEDRNITRVLIPVSGHVVALHKEHGGDLTFQLDASARYFTIPSRDPRNGQYLHILREAQLHGEPVLVTQNELGNEIVDIRRPEKPPALREVAEAAPILSPATIRPVTLTVAQAMFKLVASHSCPVPVYSASCIPFLYPDDGCFARAHEMCRLILAEGEQPAKVWNYSSTRRRPLEVQTPNSPGCQVFWRYHVAVMLRVRSRRPQSQTMVLDPALFPKIGPVPVSDWRNVQGPQDSCLVYTSPDPYTPPSPAGVQTDLNYVRTNQDLVTFRSKLEQRVKEMGPPPYKCPPSPAQ